MSKAQPKEIKLVLPELHEAQQVVREQAKRYNTVSCGRRFGKSLLGIELAIDKALEAYPAAWFAPTYKFLRPIWEECLRILQPIIRKTNAQERIINLITGGVLEFWSLDSSDVARGRKYARAVIDEAAMIPNLEKAWLEAIRPTLADFAGDAWFLSTPKGNNFFKVLYDRGQDPLFEDYNSWQMPTSANPYIAKSEVEEMKRSLPTRTYEQEILAIFRDDGGYVFRNITFAATAIKQEKAIPGHMYVVGVDTARTTDFTVITVIDLTLRELVYIDRFNQVEYALQIQRIKGVNAKFNPVVIMIEQNNAHAVIEQLQRENLPIQTFVTTNATKAKAVDDLALAFELGDLKILPDPVLIAELEAFEGEKLPSGLIRYAAPDGQHDDCVMSLLIAWQGCQGIKGALEIRLITSQITDLGLCFQDKIADFDHLQDFAFITLVNQTYTIARVWLDRQNNKTHIAECWQAQTDPQTAIEKAYQLHSKRNFLILGIDQSLYDQIENALISCEENHIEDQSPLPTYKVDLPSNSDLDGWIAANLDSPIKAQQITATNFIQAKPYWPSVINPTDDISARLTIAAAINLANTSI